MWLVASIGSAACNPAPPPARGEPTDEAATPAAEDLATASTTAPPTSDEVVDVRYVDVPGWPLSIPQMEGYAFYESVPGFLGAGPFGIRIVDRPGPGPGPGAAELETFVAELAADLGIEAESDVRVFDAPSPGIRAMIRASAVIDGYAVGGLHIILDDGVVGVLLDNPDGASRAEVDALLDVVQQTRVRSWEPPAEIDGTIILRVDPPSGWNAQYTPQGAQWVAADGLTTMGVGVLPDVVNPTELATETHRLIERDIQLAEAQYEEPRCAESHGLPWCSQVVSGRSGDRPVHVLVAVGLRDDEAWSFGGVATAESWPEARPVFETALASIRRR